MNCTTVFHSPPVRPNCSPEEFLHCLNFSLRIKELDFRLSGVTQVGAGRGDGGGWGLVLQSAS